MISRIAVRLRWLRRKLGRTHFAARLFGIRTPVGEADLPGLILIQVDGLSRNHFERALRERHLPFLNRLIQRQHFTVEDFYSGIPSTTPAVQGEIFYGVRAAVPAFQFYHRASGRMMKMYEAESAAIIAGELEAKCDDPLMSGGRSYSNIYRAGAERSRYCSQDFAPDELLRRLHPLKTLALSIFYLPKILRMLGLTLLEVGLAVVDLFRGLYQRQHFLDELAFIPARVMVSIVLREMVRFRVLLDIERGVQTIHVNFLGYDEQAHRRGPDSDFAHWTLKGIDRAIRDIHRASFRSGYRDYEIMVYSDHGQERTTPYEVRCGRPLKDALEEVFATGPLAGKGVWTTHLPSLVGNPLDRWRGFFGPGKPPAPAPAPEEGHILLAALGPVGHLYFPEPLADQVREDYARQLVATAGIPLVLLKTAEGARAYNRHGRWLLPADRAEVIGVQHPFLDEAGADLAALCSQPNAGDLILSGWDPTQPPLTFRMENGAHAGPGFEETRGFLLVPDRIRRWHVSHLARTGKRVRGEDLRRIALHFLGRDGERTENVAPAEISVTNRPLRILTYNIHSCMGLDGKVRPERIARVINHFDPDLVAVQEVDAHRPRSHEHHQSQKIADHLRMEHAFHSMLEEEKEQYGIALFSRHPFRIVKSGLLTTPGKGWIREARGAIWIRLELEGLPAFHFVNTHFGLGREERALQAEKLLGSEWLGGIPEDEPVILCGDFNSGPRSHAYRRIRERFRDVQESVTGHRPRPTFSSIRPLLRIDHIFVSRHFRVERVDLGETASAAVASDHLPLFVELSLPPP